MAPLFRFHSEDEVIAAANTTPFGLAAYFYARDLARVIGGSLRNCRRGSLASMKAQVFGPELAR